ncbi:MAG TPA: HIT domain-containing protein [Chloroflexota bacterium]|nr:HIT domain-containing protein [Chloroflexota bacterium]
MDRLWTPWRMAFVQGEKPRACIFCTLPKQNRDRENYILHRGRHNFIILNAYPYTSGHLMVVPFAHVSTIEDLEPPVTAEMMELAKRALAALRRAERPEAFNVGVNIGKAAGAGIADHVHLHVVPRWTGDNNFMPVVGNARLLPETLASTYDKLRTELLNASSRS